MAVDFYKILDGLGVKTESINRIKLGRGVIGKSATLGVFTLILLSIVAYRLTDPSLLLIIAGAGFALFIAFFVGSMIYGARYTAAALLEGAELITWQRQELAAKNIPVLPQTPSITDPKSAMSSVEQIEGPDREGPHSNG